MGDALAPWHIIILVVVLVLLFGARRLPGAAQSLGKSMHIFKQSVQGLGDEYGSAANPTSPAGPANTAPSALTAPPADATQQQLLDLQQQVADLQRQVTNGNGEAAQAPQSR